MGKNKLFSYGKWVATNIGAKRKTRIDVLQNYLNKNYPNDNELNYLIHSIPSKLINKNICSESHRNK